MDSAAGSASQGRDSKIQAILPVFGKVLNTEKNGGAVTSNKLLDVVNALGCGIGKTFDIDNLQYHKIIIMPDADYFNSRPCRNTRDYENPNAIKAVYIN